MDKEQGQQRTYSKAGSFYGRHNLPVSLSREGFSISIDQVGDTWLYQRECDGDRVEKKLLTSINMVLINPVEPLNRPKEITSYLLVEFERPLMIEPGVKRRIFVTFPIEIGVFMSSKRGFEIIDILTMQKQKFTLYGNPRTGVICKYWKSSIHATEPQVDPIRQGVMRLNVSNVSDHWVEVTRAVFNAFGMKLFYSTDLVAMKATMKILGKYMAETDFSNSPLRKDMTNSLELYTSRKLIVTAPKFIMEQGI
ncbi:MAG: hypothetical protein AMJ92_02260 [candidate division Zixibacteria bacterium SM23_81]|nr:MAG: hypothetical protein AMJ92_02260 [candidate division Zixibacteria bacterium SM23_81]